MNDIITPKLKCIECLIFNVLFIPCMFEKKKKKKTEKWLYVKMKKEKHRYKCDNIKKRKNE